MTTPTTKPAPILIHHPSTVLDDLCAFDLTHDAWARFNEQLSDQIARFEQAHRAFFVPKAAGSARGR
jgi:hypothetical protein